MRQRGALQRALARVGQRPPRSTLPESRLRLRTHRMLLGLSGGVRLHYLGSPRGSAANRGDSRLTVRVLLAEARAARSASLHAYFVCMRAAREFLARLDRFDGRGIAARGLRAVQHPTSGGQRDAVLRRGLPGENGADGRDARETLRMQDAGSPRQAWLHLLRAPDREKSKSGRASQRWETSRASRTLTSSRIAASTQRILREITNRLAWSVHSLTEAARREASLSAGAPGTSRQSTIDPSSVAPRLVSIQKYMPAAQTYLLSAPAQSWVNPSAVAQRRASTRPFAWTATTTPDPAMRRLFGVLRLTSVSVAEAARAVLADAAPAQQGGVTTTYRPATRHWLLLGKRAHAMHGQTATRRTIAARPVPTKATTRAKRITSWARSLGATMQRPAPLRPRASGERAVARLAAAQPIDLAGATAPTVAATMQLRAMPHASAQFRVASVRAAEASFALSRSSVSAPAATLSYRRTPRAAPPDATRQSSQSSQLQQQVVRQVTQELAQNTPWRGQLEQAVLAPRVLRELTERVAGAIAGRQGLERYRRGL